MMTLLFSFLNVEIQIHIIEIQIHIIETIDIRSIHVHICYVLHNYIPLLELVSDEGHLFI